MLTQTPLSTPANAVSAAPALSLADNDAVLWQSFDAAVSALDQLFGAPCAIALYQLEDGQLQLLSQRNGHNQLDGSELAYLREAINQLNDSQAAHSPVFFYRQADGCQRRAVCSAIRGQDAQMLGVLFVAWDLSASVTELAQAWLPTVSSENPLTPNSIEAVVASMIDDTIASFNGRADIGNHSKNKAIVEALLERGVFDMKDAIATVALRLNISKHTVYLYIRQLRHED